MEVSNYHVCFCNPSSEKHDTASKTVNDDTRNSLGRTRKGDGTSSHGSDYNSGEQLEGRVEELHSEMPWCVEYQRVIEECEVCETAVQHRACRFLYVRSSSAVHLSGAGMFARC